MINILIRASKRHKEFARCIQSIKQQTYKDVRLIVSSDKPEDEPFILDQINGFRWTLIPVTLSGPFSWNLYCNDLKQEVNEGWFFYLDSDDYLVNRTCLARISTQLTDPNTGIICQFNRGSLAKPRSEAVMLTSGKVGGGCIFLHHTHKNIADWDGNRAADYRFIKAVSEKLPLKFVKIVVTQAGNNGLHGR